MSVQAHPSTGLKEERNTDHTGLRGQQPGGPSKPISRRRGTVSRPPGPSHPSRRSARENPLTQCTAAGTAANESWSSSADLHRQRRSPARRALRPPPPFSSPNKHPSPEVTSLPPLAPPSRSVRRPSEATRERSRKLATSKFSSTRWHKCACATAFSAAGYGGNLVVFSLEDQSGAGPMSLHPPIFQE